MRIFEKKKNSIFIGAIVLALAFYCLKKPGCVQSDSVIAQPDTLVYFSFNQQQKEDLQAYFGLKHKNQGFNGVVLIGQKDSVFYEQAFGYANYKEKDTLDLNSVFQLASVSKQFTAVAILQLFEKGRLKLTDSIQIFFPDFPYEGITVHQLLCHRSGLPNYHYFLQHIPTTCDTMLYAKNVVEEMTQKFPEAYYKPNQRYHYSNTGYALLAAIVEKVSGLSFDKYIRRNIFNPLDMDASFTFADIGKDVEKVNTTGYLHRWRMAEDNYLDGVLGDKGIYCSAKDLFKWDQGLYSGKIIDTAILKLAFQPLGKPKYFKSNYGYGWRMFYWKTDSIKVDFHAGWWHGYKTLLLRIPKDSTTVIVLKNRSKGASIKTKRILNILYPDTIESSDTVLVESELND